MVLETSYPLAPVHRQCNTKFTDPGCCPCATAAVVISSLVPLDLLHMILVVCCSSLRVTYAYIWDMPYSGCGIAQQWAAHSFVYKAMNDNN